VSVAESEIAVLVPCFRRPQRTLRAVSSALASGAGEVIVSDDASRDGTLQALSGLRDPRLRIVEQPANLGLWPNHRALLGLTRRAWVKFLQDDDRLEPGGLAAMAAAAGPQTAVIAALTLFEDEPSGRRTPAFTLDAPLRFDSDAYLRRLPVVGNEELSTPSNTLYRAEVVETDERVWREDVSSDLIVNVLAASRGEVVLLPPGPVVTVEHSGRDTHRQSFELTVRRHRNSLRLLAGYPDRRIRRLVRIYGLAEALGSLRTAAGSLRRGRPLYAGYLGDWFGMVCACLSWRLPTELGPVLRRLRYAAAPKVRRSVSY